MLKSSQRQKSRKAEVEDIKKQGRTYSRSDRVNRGGRLEEARDCFLKRANLGEKRVKDTERNKNQQNNVMGKTDHEMQTGISWVLRG